MKEKIRFWIFPILGMVLLVALDWMSKSWISQHFARGETRSMIPGFFNLTLVHNRGAAFGIGAQWSTTFFIITSVIAVAVVVYLFYRLPKTEILSCWGLILISSGALGNVIDRIRFGYVVDFLDVYVKTYHWPAFNVADSAITIGAILYAIDLIWVSKSRSKS